MTSIKKIINAWNEYNISGGSTEWAEVVYLTQAEYDALPESKLTDGKIYKIKTSGVAPTPGGGAVIERGDILLNKIVLACDVDWYYLSSEGGNYAIILRNNYWLLLDSIQSVAWGAYRHASPTYNWYLIYSEGYSSTSWKISSYDINNSQLYQYNVSWYYTNAPKLSWEYIYIKIGETYKRFNLDLTWETDITQEEYDNVVDFWGSCNWLFYTQDGNDYVASDIEWTEVKRYVWVWTVNWIANWKLYRNVGDVAYAIATI